MQISLVIPGRNVEQTIAECLDAAAACIGVHGLTEVIFVNDGSTDATETIVRQYPVTYLTCEGKGPGGARNVGWRAAQGEYIWFVDADCILSPGALYHLISHIDQKHEVAGVGGSYTNYHKHSLLADLIHQEICERHARMPSSVNCLAGFNVLYRKDVLESLGGYDESVVNGPSSPGAEDIELSYRMHDAGYRLYFDRHATVAHFHQTSWLRYIRTQYMHGVWRVMLYARHPRKSCGDHYSNMFDHIQPILAAGIMFTILFGNYAVMPTICVVLSCVLFVLQAPMTYRIVKRTDRLAYNMFYVFAFIRAFARAAGMCVGVVRLIALRRVAKDKNENRNAS